MKPELLEKLLDAGFTKEEIFRLARDEPATPQEPAQELATPQEPTQEPATPQEPTQEPATPQEPAAAAPDKTAEALNGLAKVVEELKKAVQAKNVVSDSFGSPAESLETQTDKIMAGIIRPEHEKKEG